MSTLAGVKAPTIRYYESIGLLPAPPRTDGNRRTFNADDVQRLKFIRHARDLGFDLDAIRHFLALAAHPEQPCAEADEIARAHLADVESRINRLVALRDELRAMVDRGTHGLISECRVLEILDDHNQCLSDKH
ncbi:helix-turn-helix domain-containing protein [Paeniroseomonas aquatica]|uniref:Helix-turn-helix domain-containing protein n=1 Tax=Paeniroseomonas aquatica TaxID=373043 RepID=A0ABT8AGC2_9PROT|nr:helix-turn-helix domain-containing protein [Paeniroseomonas aquatica]MDN3568851.1 helix-turn-helix domain-containing protein [Paeniroseomonas aquatica]